MVQYYACVVGNSDHERKWISIDARSLHGAKIVATETFLGWRQKEEPSESILLACTIKSMGPEKRLVAVRNRKRRFRSLCWVETNTLSIFV